MIKRHAILIFYILAVAIALAVNLIVFPLFGEDLINGVAEAKQALNLNSFSTAMIFHDFGQSLMPLGILFPLAPTLAAIAITLAIGGLSGLGALFARLKPWRGGVTPMEAARVYFLLFLGGFGAFCAMITMDQMFGSKADIKDVLELARITAPGIAITTFLFATFTDMGAVNEELGWRGFAYPALLERFGSPLMIAVILGLLWGAWHFPREILALMIGQITVPELILDQISFNMNSIALTIIMLYFVNLLGGSIWPAIFIHGLSNYTGEMTRLVYVMNNTATEGGSVFPFLGSWALIKILIALAIVWHAGPNLGLREDRRDAMRLNFMRKD